MATKCTCHDLCEKRIARGLEPWCGDLGKISVTNRRADDEKAGIFRSYSEAVEASPVHRARWVSGGGTSGSPARFLAVRS